MSDMRSTDAEFVYFGSPEVDRLVSLVWQLAQELYVTRSRLIALEGTLTEHGALPAGALAPPALSEATKQAMAEDNSATMDRLVRVLTENDDHRTPMREQFLAALARMAPCRPGPARSVTSTVSWPVSSSRSSTSARSASATSRARRCAIAYRRAFSTPTAARRGLDHIVEEVAGGATVRVLIRLEAFAPVARRGPGGARRPQRSRCRRAGSRVREPPHRRS